VVVLVVILVVIVVVVVVIIIIIVAHECNIVMNSINYDITKQFNLIQLILYLFSNMKYIGFTYLKIKG
jgi:hypothetical protein